MERDDLQRIQQIRASLADRKLRDLNELLFALHQAKTPISKTDLASALNILPSKLTTLLNPESYRVALTDELVVGISTLLGRRPHYVRDYYRKAAA